jgi:hypothetical protein
MSTERRGVTKLWIPKGNPLKLKLYPPLRNVVEGVQMQEGENPALGDSQRSSRGIHCCYKKHLTKHGGQLVE